ncbi:MAG: leucine-rich repeat domain-containing protein [Promethearchaeota archaeon]
MIYKEPLDLHRRNLPRGEVEFIKELLGLMKSGTGFYVKRSVKKYKDLSVGVQIRKENIVGLNLYRGGKGCLSDLEESYSPYRITIEDYKLTALPQSIGNLKLLEYLDLADNKLTTLPDSFCELEALKFLDLSDNELEQLPKCFGALKSLEYLYLDHNKLINLPQSFGSLTSLKKFRAFSNELETLPESFTELKTLKEVHLGSNRLETLPKSINKLESLQYLDLIGNQLTNLPESIGNMKSLKTLFLTGNKLKMLPESLDSLTSLKWLEIGSNKLTSLPESIGSLPLHNLHFNKNNIVHLPKSLTKLSNLLNIGAEKNPLDANSKRILNELKNQMELRRRERILEPDIITGLGPIYIKKLNTIFGINTLNDLIMSDPDVIAEKIKRVSPEKAKKWISYAKKLVNVSLKSEPDLIIWW